MILILCALLVYAKDDRLTNGFQLLFDFDATQRYAFECYCPGTGLEEFNISIVNKSTEQIADGQLINVTNVDTFCGYGFIGEFDVKVYDGIGAYIIEPFPCNDFCNDLADPFNCEKGILRCFENSTESYRFVDYPCDTVWIRTLSSTEVLLVDPFIIYPNPSNGIIYVENATYDTKYRLINIQGQIVQEGTYNARGVSLPYEGVFFLTLVTEKGEWTERVVRY